MRIVAATTVTGPYIIARYRCFSERNPHHDLTLLEFGRVSNEYAWAPTDELVPYRREVLTEEPVQSLDVWNRARLITAALDRLRPEVVVVCGYGVTGMGVVLHWARRQRPPIPVVMLSDSTAEDQARTAGKEWVKSRLVRQCSSALVAGRRHRDYMRQLGLDDDVIFEGYDVVDNNFFARSSYLARQSTDRLMRDTGKLFLASARFVGKKNLHFLITAYAKYRVAATRDQRAEGGAWGLVLLGDGALRDELESLVETLGLVAAVTLPGFKQYEELGSYYGAADAFIHASTTEQWGLVVNEAMAAGLPVLVSKRCGCAPDLVEPGRNGYVFDPLDVEELARLMLTVSSDQCDRAAMGRESREIIQDWSTDKFARGLAKAVEVANAVNRARPNLLDRMLLWALACR